MATGMRIKAAIGYARHGNNSLIAIAAKVLVKLKILLKVSLGQWLDDANTLQYLPLPGGLLRVVHHYIIDQSQ
jgi:hypothetical protein